MRNHRNNKQERGRKAQKKKQIELRARLRINSLISNIFVYIES